MAECIVGTHTAENPANWWDTDALNALGISGTPFVACSDLMISKLIKKVVSARNGKNRAIKSRNEHKQQLRITGQLEHGNQLVSSNRITLWRKKKHFLNCVDNINDTIDSSLPAIGRMVGILLAKAKQLGIETQRNAELTAIENHTRSIHQQQVQDDIDSLRNAEDALNERSATLFLTDSTQRSYQSWRNTVCLPLSHCLQCSQCSQCFQC